MSERYECTTFEGEQYDLAYNLYIISLRLILLQTTMGKGHAQFEYFNFISLITKTLYLLS